MKSESLCSVCEIEKYKYSCPACGALTCSLKCFNQHKVSSNCTGKSDISLNKTTFKAKREIEDADVQRDYNFLLRVGRQVELGKQDLRSSKIVKNSKRRKLNNNQNNNQNNSEVIVKRGVTIKLLPFGMSRKQQNKTGFDSKKQKFMWTIEWILVDDELNKQLNRFVSFRTPEDSKVEDCVPFKRFMKALEENNLITPIVEPEKGIEITGELNNDSNQNIEEQGEQDELKPVTSTEADNSETDLQIQRYKNEVNQLKQKLNYFIQPEDARIAKTLIQIPTDQSLCDLIRDKTFIEYPSIYVSLKNEIKGMRVVAFGDELSSDSDSSSESDSSSNSESEDDPSDTDSVSTDSSAGTPEDSCSDSGDSSDSDSDEAPPENRILRESNMPVASQAAPGEIQSQNSTVGSEQVQPSSSSKNDPTINDRNNDDETNHK